MYGAQIILTLVLTRVILPVLVLILIGEWMRRREANYWFRS